MEKQAHNPEKHAHNHSHDYPGDGSEALRNRHPVFLGLSPQKDFFIYVSSDRSGERLKLFYGDLGESKVVKQLDLETIHTFYLGYEDGYQLTTPDETLVITPQEAKWNEVVLDVRDVADFDFTEKSSGQLIIQGKEAHEHNH